MSLNAQTQMFGTTSAGGKYNLGTAFIQYSEFPQTHDRSDFQTIIGSGGGSSHMVKAEGKIYGNTISDGPNNGGVIFSWDPETNEYNDLAYVGDVSGKFAFGSMVYFNGSLYGMTKEGGAFDGGIIYEYEIATGMILKCADLDANSGPYGELVEFNGKLLGVTAGAGDNNYGRVFSFDPLTNSVTTEVSFDYANGANPYGGLTVVGNSIYGTTSYGGSYESGVLFRIDYNGSAYTLDPAFHFTGLEGYDAEARMTYYNGYLYGMSAYGGAEFDPNLGNYGYGLIFEYNIDDNLLNVVYPFEEGTGPAIGYGEFLVKDGLFYGMTFNGGTNNTGTLFSFNPSTQDLVKLHDFTNATGELPEGSLIEYNDKLYGLTYQGGKLNFGVIFEYDQDEDDYSVKINLRENYGAVPSGALTEIDGSIYGTTLNGGMNIAGTIFRMDPVTAKTTRLFEFGAPGAQPEVGVSPKGNMIEVGGKLIGTTSSGLSDNIGSLYRFNPVAKSMQLLTDIKTGYTVSSGLVRVNDSIYGVVQQNDPPYANEMFVYKMTAGTITYHPIPEEMGVDVLGAPVLLDGKLYLLSNNGGVLGHGTIYKWDPKTRMASVQLDLDASNVGIIPLGGLTEYNGRLYGVTPTVSGMDGNGRLFSWDPVDSTYTVHVNFNGSISNAQGTLARKGTKFYGTTYGEADNGLGGIFEWDKFTNELTLIHSFDEATGYGGSLGTKLLILHSPELVIPSISEVILCTGSTFEVPFNTSESFPEGTTFSAYISDDEGDFTDQVLIGTLQTDTSGMILATLPMGITAGNGYKIKVVATDGTYAIADEDLIVRAYNGGIPPVTSIGGAEMCTGSVTKVYTDKNLGTYQWFMNGVRIFDETTDATIVTETGVYNVLVVNEDGCKILSKSIKITFHTPVAETSPYGLVDVCGNEKLTITGNSGYKYQWYLDSMKLSIADTLITYDAVLAGSYYLETRDTFGCKAYSKNIVINHKPFPDKPTVYFQYPNLISSAFYGNQWYKDGNILSGQTAIGLTPVGNGMYKTKVTLDNGCSSTSEPYNFQKTGVADLSKTSVSVYPNPVVDELTISNANGANFRITDVTGKLINSGTLTSDKSSLNVSSYATGVYNIQVSKSTGEKTTLNFVKK